MAKETYLQGTFESNSRGFGFVTVEGMDQDLFIPPDKVGGAFYGDTVEVKLLPTFRGQSSSGKGKGSGQGNAPASDQAGKSGKNGSSGNAAGGEKRRQEAEVVRVLSRGLTHLVGTFERSHGAGIVTPDNRKISCEINVNRQDSMGAVTGHKVVVEMTNYGSVNRKPEGKVVEILGHIDDPGVDILSIIRSYDLPGEFPEAVRKEVRQIPDHVERTDQELAVSREDDAAREEAAEPAKRERLSLSGRKGSAAVYFSQNGAREDWRNVPIVTIDGPDTKDIDDAISVEATRSGYRLGVHIADVSNYVKEGTALDREALNRATSNYLVDRVIPMLPHELSNGICSLNQGEDRYALSCIMELDKSGRMKSAYVTETLIHSWAKLSYPGVMKLFAEGDDSQMRHALEMQGYTEKKRGFKGRLKAIDQLLLAGRRLSKVLEKRRDERGSIDFDFKESEIILDENGHPTDIVEHERNEATMMIEDFMLLANETVATIFAGLELPFVYRTHAAPAPEKIAALREFIRNYGYKLNGPDDDMDPKEIRALLEQLKGKPEEVMISTMTLRSMQRACYTTDCGGHFGLALRYYCHFTSPIRRYPDLQIHRIIKEYLHGELTRERRQHYEEILPAVCRQSSDRERRADEAERETDKQKKAEYMKERIGQEFEGAVSGITSWGLYVELPNTVEGLIPISAIRDDYYNFDEQRYVLVGEHTGRTFELGQKLQVVCSGADTVNRTIDFVLAEDAAAARESKAGGANGQQNGNGKTGQPGHSHSRHHRHHKVDSDLAAGARQNAEDRVDTRRHHSHHHRRHHGR